MGVNEEDLICGLISIPFLLTLLLLLPRSTTGLLLLQLLNRHYVVGAMCQSYITISAVFISGFNCGTQIQILKPNLCLHFFFFNMNASYRII